MPAGFRRADAMGFFLTGAASDGGAQDNPDLALGGFRSSTEARHLGSLIADDPIPQIIVDFVFAANGEGTGTITATSPNDVAYTPPGGIQGANVMITDGDTKVAEGADRNKAIRITRDGTIDLAGSMTFESLKAFTGVISGQHVLDAERVAGSTKYRGMILRAHGPIGLFDIRSHIATLGTQAISDTTVLPASGTGTIVTTGTLADWPAVGWCHIRTSGGTTREIVYYSSRTATVLNITSAGHRGLLGTTAAAGVTTDTIDAVPGVRIAKEVAAGDGSIQTIANENTAPTAVTFSNGLTEAAGIDLDDLASGKNIGLWIEREIPAVAVLSLKQETAIQINYTAA